MKKHYVASFISMLILCMFSIGAVAQVQTSTTSSAAGKVKECRHLYLIKGNGSITGNQQTGFKLILRKTDSTIIWFADRPVRKAGSMKIADFMKAWRKGKDSFAVDPPNAVIVTATGAPMVVKLTLLDYKDGSDTFALKSIDGKLVTYSGHISVFIDAGMQIFVLCQKH